MEEGDVYILFTDHDFLGYGLDDLSAFLKRQFGLAVVEVRGGGADLFLG